jgi:hypothetical protein
VVCGGRGVALSPRSGAETKDMQGVAGLVVSQDAAIALSPVVVETDKAWSWHGWMQGEEKRQVSFRGLLRLVRTKVNRVQIKKYLRKTRMQLQIPICELINIQSVQRA